MMEPRKYPALQLWAELCAFAAADCIAAFFWSLATNTAADDTPNLASWFGLAVLVLLGPGYVGWRAVRLKLGDANAVVLVATALILCAFTALVGYGFAFGMIDRN